MARKMFRNGVMGGALWVVVAGMAVTAWGAGAICQEDFNQEKSAWTPTPPAELSPYGRSGQALKISTYVKDGEKARWDSLAFAVQPGVYTLSGWLAQNLAFTQDPGYGAVLAAVWLDKDGKELRRDEVAKVYKPPHRDKYDFFAFADKGGLPWNYYEVALAAPSGTAALRLVFTWSEFTADWRKTPNMIRGEVYLDDVLVTAGDTTRKSIAPAAAAKPFTFRLRVNTPVDSNVFLKDDPLEFTARLDGENGPPEPKAGMVLRYRVEDYQRLLVDQGVVPLAQPYQVWRKTPAAKETSLLKTFYLGDAVRRETGRWLAIRVTLEDGKQTLAEGENAFVVADPRVLSVEQARRSHFYGSGRDVIPLDAQAPWGPARRLNLDEAQSSFGVASHGWELDWKRRQPTKDSPISFEKDSPTKEYPVHGASRQTFAFEERNPLRAHHLGYSQSWAAIPEWARVPGRQRADGDYIDPAAYARYVAEYVRHTSAMNYYITECEGGDISEFPNLARAAYAAVKSVDPRLNVIAQVEFLRGQAHAQKLCESGVIDFVDTLVFDYYSGRLTGTCREFRDYLERSGKRKEYWVQEYCYTGSKDQEETSRRMADYCIWAIANGVDKLRWYGNHFIIPTIRSPLPSDGVVYGWNGMLAGQEEKLSAGMTTLPRLDYGNAYVTGNHFPFLQWGMYAQLQKHVAIEQFRAFLAWGDGVEGALFDGEGYSTAAVWRPTGRASQPMTLDTAGVPYTVVDLYGRSRRMAPVGGKSVLTIGQDPLLFRFERRVAEFKATPAKFVVQPAQDVVAPGGKGNVKVTVRNEFGFPYAADVRLALDASWTIAPPTQSLALPPDGEVELTFAFTAPGAAQPGEYPLFVSADTVAGPVAWLQQKIRVAAPVSVTLAEKPYSRAAAAGVSATVSNATDETLAGLLEITGDLGADRRPSILERNVAIPPHSRETVEFPLPGWAPSMARNYPVQAVLRQGARTVATASRVLSFRGVAKRTKPIRIDGELGDWDTEQLVAFDFFRLLARGGASWEGFNFDRDKALWKGPDDASVRFYVQWDDEKLYVAIAIRDDNYLPGGKGGDIWAHDAIHFKLYPWLVQPGEVTRGAPYQEHIGLDQDRQPTYDRIGAGRLEGVELAVKPTRAGVVMEFAVPFRHFAPLTAKAGSQFALALMYWDEDKDGRDPGNKSVAWFYGLTNVDVDPAQEGNFTLTE